MCFTFFYKFHLLHSVIFTCDSCGCKFQGRNLKKRSSDYKILCRDCSFCNKTFKIRKTINIKNCEVRYQSKPELDLINFCKVNSILIENGPKIEYTFENSSHKYLIDFKIKNMLIEIKDNHIWHRNEVESGKWNAKERAAIEYCQKNNLEYKLIMREDVKTLKNSILKYFWT